MVRLALIAAAAVAQATADAPKQYAKGFKLGSVFEANAAIPVAEEITAEERASVPRKFDWTHKGAISPVKDQGQCGSCWAFSATETIESAVYMATKQLPPALAPQQIVSCDSQDAGCNGGNPVTAYQYVEQAGGLDVESDYPYTSGRTEETGSCKWSGKKKVKVTDWKYAIKPCQSGNCNNQDEEGLKAALIKHGPLSIVVNAQVWNSYSSGVLDLECPGAMDDLDHAVQLVGYDASGSTPYWKVRNSWATVWGEEGFIRLPMGQNSCGLANLVTFAKASVEETAPAPKQYAKGFKLGSVFESNAAIPVAEEITAEERASAPRKLDWSKKGATSPVKDQGQCGSCWAFSATETIESAVYMATKQLPPALAPQQIVSCDSQDAGCNGGNPVTAYQYVEQAGGIDVESDYPYTSGRTEETGSCRWSGKKKVKVTDWKYAIKPCQSGNCRGQDEEGLKAALAKHGPLSIVVNAQVWNSYSSGVLDLECPGAMDDLDHAVQLVGYDTTGSTPYWKVRNSWATVWGEEGFIRLPMGQNSCGLANLVTYASASLETDETSVMV